MGKRDPRVDAYISSAAAFAQPILTELRERVHKSCPDVVETIKWKSVSFEHQGIMCGMAAFKAHCAFGFWKHDLVVGKDAKALEAAGSVGRITKLSELPSKSAFAAMVKKAAELNEKGVKVERPKHEKTPIKMHPELEAALRRNKKARAAFDRFPPSHKREYLEWITEAKRDETRARRVAQAVEWMAEGKSRNWKYESC